ncbi:hypothetical protein R1sor_017271 [Riccia sorocarpa]|uniref:Transcription factor TFIIIC triple barrel domain-containing protein n=1 Tax=Riccia sorocarpa TaxID=122646 RepID=A0ABD3I852_9MARC
MTQTELNEAVKLAVAAAGMGAPKIELRKRKEVMEDDLTKMAECAPEPPLSTEETVNTRNQGEEEDEEEEYVMLDLSQIFHGAALPPNCSYTLSGLDTMNPVLTLGDDLKLIGEYEEAVGTILVLTEREEEVLGEERKRGISENHTRKRISNFCKTERKLKFRIMDEEERKGEKKKTLD